MAKKSVVNRNEMRKKTFVRLKAKRESAQRDGERSKCE